MRCGCFERGKRTAAAGNQEAAEIYWAAGGQTGTGTVSGRAGVLLGETQYNDVEAMAAYFKSRCSCCGSRYAFSRRRLSGAAVPIRFCLCFTVRPVRCRKPWMFFRRLWHIITVWCRITVPVLNMYWHRKRIFSAVIGKKRLFGNGSTECFTAQRTGRRRAVC